MEKRLNKDSTMSFKIVKHHFIQTYKYSFTRHNSYFCPVNFDALITSSKAAKTVNYYIRK